MQVIVLNAVRKDPYDDCPTNTFLGVFSDNCLAEQAIMAYQERMKRIHCEVLLENTKFSRTVVELNERKY